MSLFHGLQDVYYDAMHLQEALEAIPSKCDCLDAEAHLSGQCCCVSGEGTVGGAMAFRRGCLHHLEKLSKSLTALLEDSRGGSGETRLEEMDQKLLSRLSDVMALRLQLDTMVEEIEDRIEQFKVTCAQADLLRLKESASHLQKLVTELNGLL